MGNILKQKKSMKILGYMINKDNSLDNHMSTLMSKMTNSYNNIRGAILFLSPKNC